MVTNRSKVSTFGTPNLWSLIKASLKGVEFDYTKMLVDSAVILLAVPMMLETLIEALFAVSDIFFVAKLGPDAIATVGLTEAVITLLYAVGVGLGLSITALIARRIGEGNHSRAALLAGQSVLVGILLSLAIGIAGAAFAKNILSFIGAPAVVIDRYYGYTAIMLGGSITILMLFIFNGIYRGIGDPVIAMKAIWIASIINIVLDPCLIFGLGPFPDLGVEGAAIASNLGRGIGVVYVVFRLFQGSLRITLERRHFMPDRQELALLFRVSAGGILQFLIATSSWIFLMKIMAVFGSVVLAGYTIAIRVIDFILMPVWGLSNSVSTMVGQNLGAGKIDRARDAVYVVARFNICIMLAISIIFIFFAEGIIGFFTSQASVVEIGSECLRLLSYGFVFYGLGLVMIQAFNGAGDTRTPTWINAICFWIFQLPFAYWLALVELDNPKGVFWAILIAECLMPLFTLAVFLKGRWIDVRV